MGFESVRAMYGPLSLLRGSEPQAHAVTTDPHCDDVQLRNPLLKQA